MTRPASAPMRVVWIGAMWMAYAVGIGTGLILGIGLGVLLS